MCPGGGMADAVDLKSPVRKGVRVRLPPRALLTTALQLKAAVLSLAMRPTPQAKPNFVFRNEHFF